MTDLNRMLRWLYLKCWKEPKDIRGVTWTLCLYLWVLTGVAFWSEVSERGLFFLGLTWAVTTWLFNRVGSKPKRLGRPLPYRRKR